MRSKETIAVDSDTRPVQNGIGAERDWEMNLTVSIDDDILERARSRAIRERTSVNAVVWEYLRAYAGIDRQRAEACDSLLALSQSSGSRRGGAVWTRSELHER